MLEQTSISSKINRIEKNIKNKTEHFQSLFSQIDSQAKMMQSQATMWFQNQAGLGTNSVDPWNYTGMNAYVMQQAYAIATGQGMPYQNGTDANGNPTYAYHKVDPATWNNLSSHYQQNNGNFVGNKDTNGNPITKKGVLFNVPGGTQSDIPVYTGFTHEDTILFKQAMQQAQMQQQQAQQWVHQSSNQYQNNVSIWVEAQKAALEAEQDAVLEPLNYEQAMLEIDKEFNDQRLKRIEQEIQSYEGLEEKGAERMVPTFGLK